ncbi:MAG: heme-binding protein [Clostridia bacterium]|nr:heme-binding protein [Clostridia bacterium]
MKETELKELIRQVVERNEFPDAAAAKSLRSIQTVTLRLAKALAAAVEEEAARIGVNAVVVVSDQSGRPILAEVMDDAFIASYDVALQKAFTVVSLKMSTIDLKPLAQPNGPLYGIQFTNDSHIVIFGGGEPLRVAGTVVGGLGVSGGTEEQDTALAAYGAKVFAELFETL